ncbi:MAG: adenylate/guanylate cyclase domain-containing protein [Pseudohongiellaceae bacterium]
MALANSLFSFRSFRSRLIVFLLCLLIPVLGGIFYYVNTNNTEYTEETINSYLELGADVFDYTREQQALTLQSITNSLTWDFGFRTAYAANDPATLFDAALNVLDRSMNSADMLLIVGLDGRVIIDTETQGMDELTGPWQQLLDVADASEEGRSDMIITIDGLPFQVIALPLYLPRQVAWIIGGFALDQEFVERVKETTVSEVSIVKRESANAAATPAIEVIVSTLSAADQSSLSKQMQFDEAQLSSLQRINADSQDYTSLLRRLYGESGDPLQVFAVIQRSYDENSENVVQFRALLIQFYLLVLVVSLLAVLFLARSISTPLSRLAAVVKKIEEGDYNRSVSVSSRDEIGVLSESVNSMARGLAEKEKVRDLLGKVVSHEIAEQLLNNPIELGGEERVATILFSDIRGFTTFCEGLPPKEVLKALNTVLSKISDIVESHQGVVDKYNGDAVMALFGVPIKGEQDTENAMAALLEITAALGSMDSRLSACVGINTGVVVAGNLGSSNRMNYSVIGDTVNLAARLESLTRLYNVSNIVSAASKADAANFVYRELDVVCVAGKSQAVRIFELIGRQGQVSAEKLSELDEFAAALTEYRVQNWGAAQALFSQLQIKCDNAPLCQVFLDRIELFRENPPPADWQGEYVFDSK